MPLMLDADVLSATSEKDQETYNTHNIRIYTLEIHTQNNIMALFGSSKCNNAVKITQKLEERCIICCVVFEKQWAINQ